MCSSSRNSETLMNLTKRPVVLVILAGVLLLFAISTLHTDPQPINASNSARQATPTDFASAADVEIADVVPRRELTQPSVGEPLSVASSSFSCMSDDYLIYTRHVMESTLGPSIVAAMYHPDAFNYAATNLGRGVHEYPDSLVWQMNNLRGLPVAPDFFTNSSNIVWHAKRLLSIGLARWQRDAELAAMLKHFCSSEVAFRVFDRAMRRTVEAFAQYFHTVMQLAIDVSHRSWKDKMYPMQQRYLDIGDPLILLVASVTPRDSIFAIESLLSLPETQLAQVLEQQAQIFRQQKRKRVPHSKLESVFPLYYHDQAFDSQDPINGKFWNMIRPTATCSSLVRLCELPDGCRLLCNAEYLLHAGTSSSIAGHSSNTQKPYAHRVAGFGCNNDYDWEISLNRMFSAATASHAEKTNTLGWVTVFDCTLTMTAGPRKWAPPEVLRQAPIGFGFVPLCLDGNKSQTALSPRDVKQFLLKAESEARSGRDGTSAQRFKVSRAALEQAPDAHHAWVTTTRKPNIRLFDGISILKADVEGFEFNTIPSWSRAELRNIAEKAPHAVAEGAASLINFEEAASDFLSVSLFSMEFHRMGHKKAIAASKTGALRAHYLMLHIYSLGFIMVGHEKNQYDQCCYEQAWSHVRHYARSETWMVTGDTF